MAVNHMHVFRQEFGLRRCADWKYVYFSKGDTHGISLCSAPARHRGRTLGPETHVSLILDHVHVKLTILRLDAALRDTEPLCIFVGVAYGTRYNHTRIWHVKDGKF